MTNLHNFSSRTARVSVSCARGRVRTFNTVKVLDTDQLDARRVSDTPMLEANVMDNFEQVPIELRPVFC